MHCTFSTSRMRWPCAPGNIHSSCQVCSQLPDRACISVFNRFKACYPYIIHCTCVHGCTILLCLNMMYATDKLRILLVQGLVYSTYIMFGHIMKVQNLSDHHIWSNAVHAPHTIYDSAFLACLLALELLEHHSSISSHPCIQKLEHKPCILHQK